MLWIFKVTSVSPGPTAPSAFHLRRSDFHPVSSPNRLNVSTSSGGVSELSPDPSRLSDVLVTEAILAFFLLLLLVWFLNRESEVSHRLHYHGNVEADKHRSKIQTLRDQAEWLLGNIIPIHVADQLKVCLFKLL